MSYWKTLYETPLRKLPVKHRIIAIFCFSLFPLLIVSLLLLLNIPLWLRFSIVFYLGFLFRNTWRLITFAFGKRKHI